MTTEEMIAANEFCRSHNIEFSFLNSLSESGLVHIIKEQETFFISGDELPQVEKLVSFHYDMDINLEGIEALHHLLEQVKMMQAEMRALKNRLSLYETVEGLS
jgi:hypothetical protein